MSRSQEITVEGWLGGPPQRCEIHAMSMVVPCHPQCMEHVLIATWFLCLWASHLYGRQADGQKGKDEGQRSSRSNCRSSLAVFPRNLIYGFIWLSHVCFITQIAGLTPALVAWNSRKWCFVMRRGFPKQSRGFVRGEWWESLPLTSWASTLCLRNCGRWGEH